MADVLLLEKCFGLMKYIVINKKPKHLGGTDDYFNLIILHKNVHKLIHAVNEETISSYISLIKPDEEMLEKR